MPEEIKEAVEKAAADLSEENAEQETETETEETEKTEEEPSESDKIDTKQAVQLYKLLNDPETAKDAVLLLAKRLGIETAKTPTQVKSIAAEVKEILGDEYEFLGAKLGNAIEKLLPRIVEEHVKPVKLELQQQQAQLVRREIDDAFDKINQDTKGDFSKYEKQINKLMDEIKPSENQTPHKYLNHLYKIAKFDAIENERKISENKKVAQNAKDKQGLSSGVNETRVVKSPSGQIGLREAVEAAARGIRFED